MKMKKIVAGVVAAVLSMALCAPAFAATPGEVADDNAREVIGLTQNWNEAGNAEAAETAMQEMVDTLRDSSVTVSTYMTSAGLSYFDALEENGKPGTDYGKEMLYLSDGTVSAVVRYAKTGFSVGGELSVSDDAVITYTANPQHPSSTGYAITVYLPDDATATQYSIRMLGDNAQPNDSVVPVNSYVEEDGSVQKYVSFWVPHFTTYQLTPVGIQIDTDQPEQPAQQPADEHPEIADAIANGTWGQSSATAAGSTAGSASTTENPIKKTGLSMDFGVFAVAALTVAAVCGLGYAATKSRKSE